MALRQTTGPCDSLKAQHEQLEAELIQAELDRQADLEALSAAQAAYDTSVESRDSAAEAAGNAYQAWIDCLVNQT